MTREEQINSLVGHCEKAARLAYGVLRDHHEAEDAAQEAFVRTVAHLDDLREPDALKAYFYQTTRNRALTVKESKIGLRHFSAFPKPFDDVAGFDPRTENPEEAARATNPSFELAALIDRATLARRRDALHWIVSGSYEEMAEQSGTETHLARAAYHRLVEWASDHVAEWQTEVTQLIEEMYGPIERAFRVMYSTDGLWGTSCSSVAVHPEPDWAELMSTLARETSSSIDSAVNTLALHQNLQAWNGFQMGNEVLVKAMTTYNRWQWRDECCACYEAFHAAWHAEWRRDPAESLAWARCWQQSKKWTNRIGKQFPSLDEFSLRRFRVAVLRRAIRGLRQSKHMEQTIEILLSEP